MSLLSRVPIWAIGAAVIGGGLALASSAKGAPAGGHPKGTGPMPTIKRGSTGPAVAVWRAVVGVAPGSDFDDATTAATKAWQGAHGLTADGIVGPKSWAAAGYSGAPAQARGGGASAPAGAAPSTFSLPEAPPPAGGSDSGRSWAATLPPQATEDRNAAIVAAVKASFYVAPALVPVTYQKGEHSVTIFAWADCLNIGFTDPVRVNVSHAAGQVIADMLSLSLPTTRMSDAAWEASSVKLMAQTTPADAQMASTKRMQEHSDKVSHARMVAGLPAFGGMSRPNGKDWVNTERLLAGGRIAVPTHSTIGPGGGVIPAGANYGWQNPAAGLWNPPRTIHVFQSVGLAHDMNYTDYSQVLTLYANWCQIDGASRSLVEVLQNPDLAYCLSDEVERGTPCRVWRHPGVS